jgi:hypothetical protein
MILLDDDLLGKIISKYGKQEQLRQAMGECGELIAVIQNYYRSVTFGHRTETFTHVAEEAVDVFFMIQQIRNMEPKLFDAICKSKQQKVIEKVLHEDFIEKKFEFDDDDINF